MGGCAGETVVGIVRFGKVRMVYGLVKGERLGWAGDWAKVEHGKKMLLGNSKKNY